jgi:hypothetical protein
MRAVSSAVLLISIVVGAGGIAAACGGSGSDNGTPNGTEDATAGDGTEDGAPVVPITALAIEPPEATLTVTDPAKTLSQVYVAKGTKSDGSVVTVPAAFSVDNTAPGTIDPASGTYTTSNKAGGTVTVTATYDGKTATAKMNVVLKLSVTPMGGPTSDLFDPTKVTVGTDPTKTPSFIYPSTGTMFPQNVYKILFQWRKSGLNAFEVKFEGPGVTVNVYTNGINATCTFAATNAGCWEADLGTWTWIASTLAGKTATVTVTGVDTTKPGTVYKSKSIEALFSKKEVPGAIYYWSTTVAGVRKATVSDAAPTNFLTPAQTGQCVACHTLSRNGKRLGADVGGETEWIAEVSTTFPPPILLKKDPAMRDIPNSWMTFNPDTSRHVTSAKGLLTLRDDKGKPLGAGTNGIIPLGTGVFGHMPDWSPDGKFLVFAKSASAGGRKVAAGTISIIPSNGDDTFGAIVDLVKSTSNSDNNYFPMFAPTSEWIAYGHSTGSSEKEDNSILRIVSVMGGTPFDLTRANTIVNDGLIPAPGASNNQPTWAPKTEDGIMWVAFQSKRDYGVILGGGSKYGADKNQLWVAAIDTTQLGKADPSFPAFRLPFQELTENNHRPFWAEDATKPPPGDAGPPPDAGTDSGPPCVPRFGDCSTGGTCCDPYTCEPTTDDPPKYTCREVIK